MAAQTVYFKVDFTIHEGKLAVFEETAKAMIAGTWKEPGALGYEWYLAGDGKSGRLIETFEVYGDPGPQANAILAGFGAAIFEFRQGLTR